MVATLLLAVVLMLVPEFTDAQHYGEFKDKFKANFICSVYIPLSLFYRIAMAIYLSSQTDYQESTLLILALTLAYLLYFIINLPFTDWFQNYRAGLCHLTQLIILLTANYYRSMKSNTPLSIKSRQHTFAVVELVMILLCVVVSAVVLVVEVVQWGRELCLSRRNRRIMEEARKHTEASMADIHADVPTELKNT